MRYSIGYIVKDMESVKNGLNLICWQKSPGKDSAISTSRQVRNPKTKWFHLTATWQHSAHPISTHNLTKQIAIKLKELVSASIKAGSKTYT